MRRYDDPVDVRRGQVSGTGGGPVEGPEQFLWKGRLGRCARCSRSGWRLACGGIRNGVHAVLGADEPHDRTDGGLAGGLNGGLDGRDSSTRTAVQTDLAAEREVWRVEADRGMSPAQSPGAGGGVFDLVFDWADGSWRLTRCLD